jgi:glycosyltransferase involved in cell wall biosynthesis
MDGHPYDALFRFEVRLGVLLSRFADLIICNSEAGRDHHVGLGYLPQNMIVVPNGIDVERFRPDAGARAELRAEWSVGTDETLIGLIGRLDPMKDPQNFLQAAARLARPRPGLRVVCAGDGPEAYRDELKALAAELGIAERVLWSPARVDVWRVYNALDVCVSSSAFGEGFSNTIAEAMATGVPCVVTNVGDSAIVVGDRGWVCPPRDSAALAQAIEAALGAMPADAAAIRQRIAVNYSSSALLHRTVSHLTQLLGPAGAARYVCDPE